MREFRGPSRAHPAYLDLRLNQRGDLIKVITLVKNYTSCPLDQLSDLSVYFASDSWLLLSTDWLSSFIILPEAPTACIDFCCFVCFSLLFLRRQLQTTMHFLVPRSAALSRSMHINCFRSLPSGIPFIADYGCGKLSQRDNAVLECLSHHLQRLVQRERAHLQPVYEVFRHLVLA